MAGLAGEPATFAIGPPGEVAEVTVDLVTTGALVARVAPPADDAYAVALSTWDETRQAWRPPIAGNSTSTVGGERADANGVLAFRDLRTGRYRVFDAWSGLATDAVDVRGGETTEIRLDLARSGWAEGRVEAPSGSDLAGATVRVDDGPPRPAAGAFKVRVPGDRTVRIAVGHPTLQPDPLRGHADVTAPRDGIVLRLVAGPTASLRFDPPLGEAARGSRPRWVLLFSGPVAGDPAFTREGVLDAEGRSLAFGAPPPGTYTVWIDAGPFAPVVLPDRRFGDGDTDLGAVPPSGGSRWSSASS